MQLCIYFAMSLPPLCKDKKLRANRSALTLESDVTWIASSLMYKDKKLRANRSALTLESYVTWIASSLMYSCRAFASASGTPRALE